MFQSSLPMIHVWLSTAVRKGPVAAATTVASEAATVARTPFMIDQSEGGRSELEIDLSEHFGSSFG